MSTGKLMKVPDELAIRGKETPLDKTLSQLMVIYLLVVATISASWGLGTYQYSFIWVFAMVAALFVVWKTKLTNIIRNRLMTEESRIHRKRALKQSETGEWLNFILNRWWVFSSNSIEDIVKKKIDERLVTVKPSFVTHLELITFTFGEKTPALKYVQAFELSDGVPGGRRPVSWNTINIPPAGLHKMSNYQIVIEVNMENYLEDFKMVFRSKVGYGRAGLTFDVAVEELGIVGNLQIILQMSMDLPFPHVSKATISFVEMPQVWFNVQMLKALQIMEVPLLKTWVHTHIMDGLTKALVDPGKIDIPIASAGPVQKKRQGSSQQKLAQGVLTLSIKGYPVKNPDSNDVRYTMIRLGNCKRQTPDALDVDEWEDACSFFVYNLATEKLIVKSKCRRLLSNVTLEYHEIDLSSHPLEIKSGITETLENKDGSKIEVKMHYTSLPPISLDPTQVPAKPDVVESTLAGVMMVCVHSAKNVMASDVGGTSDPYCVVFCDRRRVHTTPYVQKNLSPVWESSVEFFVKDFTKAALTFFVYDWDGTSTIDDDFLGATHYTLKEDQTVVIKDLLPLGYNDRSEGFVEDRSFGHITVSIVFRPVPSVTKSEKFRLTSVSGGYHDYLYKEDSVSPSSVPTGTYLHSSVGENSNQGTKYVKSRSRLTGSDVRGSRQARGVQDRDISEQGGGPGHPVARKKASMAGDLMDDKTFVDLTLLQAKDLMGMDRNGLSDPYCEVLMGSQKVFRTSVKKNTLFPKWNESTSFQVLDDSHLLEINVYDKDMISKDFLGKIVLSVEKMKELSHKGTSEWVPLQRTKSGQVQLKCAVTCSETVDSGVRSRGSRRSKRSSQNSNDVFLPSVDSMGQSSHGKSIPEEKVAQTTKPPPPDSPSSDTPDGKIVPQTAIKVTSAPRSTPPTQKSGSSDRKVTLGRSASDLSFNQNREVATKTSTLAPGSTLKHTDSVNSFHALHPGGDNYSLDGSVVGVERIYSVSGKVLQIRGLKTTSNSFYVKIRLERTGSRIRLMSHSRVIAKSSMVPISNPIFNQPFEIDRGAGVNVDTNIIFDIKDENKGHMAQKSYSLRQLFQDYVQGEVQQWLKLSNGIEIRVVMSQGKPNPRLVNRKQNSFLKSLSFRKEKP